MIKHLEYISPFNVAMQLKDMDGFIWLDSSLTHHGHGRYSFMCIEPFAEFTGGKKPLKHLRTLLKKYHYRYNGIPFGGGAAGFFSYDLLHQIEKVPNITKDDLDIPDVHLGLYDNVIGWDHFKKRCWIVSLPISSSSKKQFRKILEIFKNNKTEPAKIPYHNEEKTKIKSCFTKNNYIKRIQKIKKYIYAGDVYQINFSQRLCCNTKKDPFEIYNALRNTSPAPFSAYLSYSDFKILSSSPECFITYNPKTRIVQTRPIKGTFPRGNTKKTDELLAKRLIKSKKDRAEHIMIVDLERNDLGKLCENGTIRVSKTMELEGYSNVWHLVSTIQGRVKTGYDSIDILKATFPGGSITGAPKIRSMQIIEEVETFKRGIYTGSIGYIGFAMDISLSIAIRTMVYKKSKIYFSVGGGIVADSDPLAEYNETMDKAAGMIRAITR